jgi:hypothetical protein
MQGSLTETDRSPEAKRMDTHHSAPVHSDLVWSVVLAVVYPAYDWLSAHLGKRPRIAAW